MRRHRGDEGGFTLIELMVVVLIIAILIAIAIPTFLGAQDRARDRSAQQNLRNALVAVRTVSTDNNGYYLNDDGDPLGPGDLPDVEPAIDFDAVTAVGDQVLLTTEAGGVATTMVAESASGTFFGVTVNRDGQVLYCEGEAQTDCDEPGDAAYTTSW